MTITYSERVFLAFGIQHAMRMSHSHLWPARVYSTFSQYLMNSTIFENNIFEYKKGVLICLQILSETYIVLIRTGRVMVKNIFWSSWKVSVILVIFKKKKT